MVKVHAKVFYTLQRWPKVLATTTTTAKSKFELYFWAKKAKKWGKIAFW